MTKNYIHLVKAGYSFYLERCDVNNMKGALRMRQLFRFAHPHLTFLPQGLLGTVAKCRCTTNISI